MQEMWILMIIYSFFSVSPAGKLFEDTANLFKNRKPKGRLSYKRNENGEIYYEKIQSFIWLGW